jgi:Glycosyl transferase family 2
MLAPIALFAYSRPDHLARTLDALRGNAEAAASQLYVFSDAPRNEDAKAGVAAVRKLLTETGGFASANIILREQNFGLAGNITDGVSDVLARHTSVIVVEDDVMVTPHFLRFMNDALEFYRDEPRVGSITGYCYPLKQALPETFFIKGADCWGWATWRDRWTLYNPDGRALLNELESRGLTDVFDFDGNMAYTAMLRDQIAGKNDSWAVRWHASCFLKDRLILYPSESRVHNIGNDGSGTHAKTKHNAFDVVRADGRVKIGGIAIEESVIGRRAFCDFFHDINAAPAKQSFAGRLSARLGRFTRRMADS